MNHGKSQPVRYYVLTEDMKPKRSTVGQVNRLCLVPIAYRRIVATINGRLLLAFTL